mmetsp:Transcript_47997/g.145009  ORF Transcript_47997/g.145009 Transcript_47997/m.145009 type:complete len:471 (-) Transcript_47997:157-1569(-)
MASETGRLLPPGQTGEQREDRAEQRTSRRAGVGRASIFEALRLEAHESAEVSNVELFSDLAVVVAIHVLSDTIVEEGRIEDASYSVTGEIDQFSEPPVETHQKWVWLWFFLRVEFLFTTWHAYMYLTNLCNSYSNNAMGVRHYGVIFGMMILTVLFIKACQNDDNRTSVIIFVVGHIANAIIFAAEARIGRPTWIDPDRYNNILHLSRLMNAIYTLEIIGLLVALVFFPEDDTYLLWGGLWMAITQVALRSFLARYYDSRPNYDTEKLFDKEHLHERFGLITLIFLGELCFAAATEAGEYLISLCALATGMGAFLNYFAARVDARTEAWHQSAESSVCAQQLHVPLFCAIPSISVGFVQMMQAEEREGSHETDDAETNKMRTGVILGLASGAFHVLMGFLELLTSDPSEHMATPNMKQGVRVALNHFVGALLMASPFIMPPSSFAIFVSGLTLLTGLVQVIATRTQSDQG